MNQIDLKNRKAVITGGAQGIGLAIAERVLDSGASPFPTKLLRLCFSFCLGCQRAKDVIYAMATHLLWAGRF